jgi:hypothetical protein
MDALFIIKTYCLLDDTLKVMGHRDHHHAAISTAEILTVGLIAAKYFQNHHERTLYVLCQLGYLPHMSVSRFNRRWHQAWNLLTDMLDYWSSQRVTVSHYVVDAMPVPVCRMYYADQCRKIPQTPGYIGRNAAKKQWFCGWRLHWVCDIEGFPIAFDLVPALWHELTPLQLLLTSLPEGSFVFGDGAYISREHEILAFLGGIRLIPERHMQMNHQNPEWQMLKLKRYRAKIESQHGVLETMGVQRLRAVTPAGFALKVYASLAVLAVNLMN